MRNAVGWRLSTAKCSSSRLFQTAKPSLQNHFVNKYTNHPTSSSRWRMHHAVTPSRGMCSSPSAKTDLDLQRDYEGIIPRLQSIWNAFSNDDSWSEMNNLSDSKVIPDGYIRLFTYADLKNPLLEKYQFNPTDFMKGATYAFERVHKAIGSVELVNFASGVIKESDTNNMLKATLSPQIYKATIEASKAMHDKIYLRKIDFQLQESHLVSIVTDVIEEENTGNDENVEVQSHQFINNAKMNMKMKESSVRDVEVPSTIIVDNLDNKKRDGTSISEEPHENTDSLRNLNAVVKEEETEIHHIETKNQKEAGIGDVKVQAAPGLTDSPVIMVEKTEISSQGKLPLTSNTDDDDTDMEKESVNKIEKLKYPKGSVVATATVYIRGEETIEYVLPSMSPAGESVNREQTTPVRFSWTFRGCISDHSELDWKIIALDGFGDTTL